MTALLTGVEADVLLLAEPTSRLTDEGISWTVSRELAKEETHRHRRPVIKLPNGRRGDFVT